MAARNLGGVAPGSATGPGGRRMSTLALTKALMSIFVPIGVTGAVIALVCALVAVIALARGAAGLAGGAIGVWIVGALLSLAASFANEWLPVLVALLGLAVALVAGAMIRLAVRTASASRAAAPAVSAAPAVESPVVPAARPAGVRAPVRTESLRVAS